MSAGLSAILPRGGAGSLGTAGGVGPANRAWLNGPLAGCCSRTHGRGPRRSWWYVRCAPARLGALLAVVVIGVVAFLPVGPYLSSGRRLGARLAAKACEWRRLGEFIGTGALGYWGGALAGDTGLGALSGRVSAGQACS